MLRNGIIIVLDPLQPGLARIGGEKRSGDQHVGHLWGFKKLPSDPILDQVLATPLLHGNIR